MLGGLAVGHTHLGVGGMECGLPSLKGLWESSHGPRSCGRPPWECLPQGVPGFLRQWGLLSKECPCPSLHPALRRGCQWPASDRWGRRLPQTCPLRTGCRTGTSLGPSRLLRRHGARGEGDTEEPRPPQSSSAGLGHGHIPKSICDRAGQLSRPLMQWLWARGWVSAAWAGLQAGQLPSGALAHQTTPLTMVDWSARMNPWLSRRHGHWALRTHSVLWFR